MENKTTYIVNISEAESDYIEKLQYEQHVHLNILHYLLKQGDIDDTIIQKYNKRIVDISTELEIAKNELVMMYIPNNDQVFDYTIDFRNKRIVYNMRGDSHDA